MKRDIALPHKKEKKPKKASLKQFFKSFLKDPPKNKFVRLLTHFSLVFAVAAFILALIPPLSTFGLWLAVLAVALGLFCFFRKDGRLPRRILLVSAVVLAVAIASVTIQNIYQQSLIDRELYLRSGDATEEILRGDLAVSFGKWNNDGLAVTLKNGHSENKGYNVLVEAKDENGLSIINEMISVGGIAPGKSTTMTIFKRLTESQKKAMSKAKFEVISVSQF